MLNNTRLNYTNFSLDLSWQNDDDLCEFQYMQFCILLKSLRGIEQICRNLIQIISFNACRRVHLKTMLLNYILLYTASEGPKTLLNSDD